ncbi:hypothetical protein VNO78_17015 [Psophocarpus tetragonolobus]|uniref:Uncharacterized protein n=1 Tax=Psophocarpus tetragonolobus TaxID=3891 RepID=A0AAN9SGJ5_PSOTE
MLCNENGGTNTERFWLLIYIPKSLSSPSPSNPYPLNSINCRTAPSHPHPRTVPLTTTRLVRTRVSLLIRILFLRLHFQRLCPNHPRGLSSTNAAKFSLLPETVDPANNLSLESVVRRQLTSSQGDDCMLLCPDDMPIQMLKNTSDGWLDVSDEELESILPAAAYALAKIRLYLIHSGYVRLLP